MGSAGGQPPREIVEYRFDTWQPAQLQRLELMLSSHDISRVWAGIHLEIGADSEERVD
ncbi:MAG: hypothetical protein GY929_21360, partial [Actinomycetia bacterium]|nr:hypothetical protein [Actinomycetes bacterium]